MSAQVFGVSEYQSKIKEVCKEKIERKDYVGALSLLFKLLEEDYKNTEILTKIADVYFEMNLYDYALKYRLKALAYLSKKDRLMVMLDIITDSVFSGDYKTCQNYIVKVANEFGHQAFVNLEEDAMKEIGKFQVEKEFYQVYPFTEKSYEKMLKDATKLFKAEFFREAKSAYETVPAVKFSDEDIKNYFECCEALTSFNDCLIKLKEINAERGENLVVYTLMSVIYFEQKNADKSRFYYEKALKLYDGKKNDTLSLFYSAINFGEHETLYKLLKKLVEFFPYDDVFAIKLATACYNLGKLEESYEAFKKAKRILPFSVTLNGYLQLIKRALDGENGLPKTLSYDAETEEEYLISARETVINRLEKLVVSKKKNCKKPKIEMGLKEAYDLTISLNDKVIGHRAIYLLLNEKKKWATELEEDLLLDPGLDGETKRQIMYAKISSGFLGTIKVVDDCDLYEVKPEKLPSEISNNVLFMCAHALTISKCFVADWFKESKIKKGVVKVYRKIGKIMEDDVGLLSAIIVITAYPEINSKSLCAFYDVNEEKLEKYLLLVNEKGEKND